MLIAYSGNKLSHLNMKKVRKYNKGLVIVDKMFHFRKNRNYKFTLITHKNIYTQTFF